VRGHPAWEHFKPARVQCVMRRNLPHIAVALLAFSVGYIAADDYKNLVYALPLSLLTFLVTRSAARIELDLHFIIVVVMSLLLWAAGLAELFSSSSWESESCVIDFTTKNTEVTGEESEGVQPSSTEMPPVEMPHDICGGTDAFPANPGSIWAGVLNRKATIKPAPNYPPIAKAARAGGTVAVWVLIDESGKVVWSQALSGHPLLRQSAMQAACSARFSRVATDGPHVRVSGVLTYTFLL
jgi:TonB family protein